MTQAEKVRVALAFAVLLGCSSPAAVAQEPIVATHTEGSAQPYLGSEFREAVNEAVRSRPTLAEGMKRIQPVLAWCDAKASNDEVTYLSVDTDVQAKDYRDQHPSRKNVVLIDRACPSAYKLAAFLYVDARDFPQALGYLDKAVAIAPYFAEAYSERGFILNQSGNAAAAADSYRRALALLERDPDRQQQGVAMRGLGYSLVELGELGAARVAYERSLKVDPDSKVARDELDYILGEEKKSGAPLQSANANALVPTISSAPLGDVARKVIAATRSLEAEPLAETAPSLRSLLLEWESKTPEVSILVCETTGLLSGPKHPFQSELLVQGMFGIAAWQLENPGRWDDELAAQAAGVRSMLKAYSAFLAARPKEHLATFDELLAVEAAGKLDAQLAPIVAEKCSRKDAVKGKAK